MVLVAREIQGMRKVPTSMTASRKPNAIPVVAAIRRKVTFSPRTRPVTTVKITSPRMSSITAAPRMICPSTSRSRPRSDSTRAVIPTLVAVKVAPAMIAAMLVSPSALQTANPRPNGKNDAHDGDCRRGRSHPHKHPDISLQADRQEQDEDPQLREHVHRLVARADQVQARLAHDHTADEFPQNRRLTDPLGQRSADLGHSQHDHQHREQVRDLYVLHPSDLSPQSSSKLASGPGPEGVKQEFYPETQANTHPP